MSVFSSSRVAPRLYVPSSNSCATTAKTLSSSGSANFCFCLRNKCIFENDPKAVTFLKVNLTDPIDILFYYDFVYNHSLSLYEGAHVANIFVSSVRPELNDQLYFNLFLDNVTCAIDEHFHVVDIHVVKNSVKETCESLVEGSTAKLSRRPHIICNSKYVISLSIIICESLCYIYASHYWNRNLKVQFLCVQSVLQHILVYLVVCLIFGKSRNKLDPKCDAKTGLTFVPHDGVVVKCLYMMEPDTQKSSLEGSTMPRATASPACPTPPLSNISAVALSDFGEADSGPSTPSSCAPSPATSEKSGRSSRASSSTIRSARKKDSADIGYKPKVLLNKLNLTCVEENEDGRKSSASNPHSRSSTPDKVSFGGGKRKNSTGSLGLESSSKKKKTSKGSAIGSAEQSTALNDNYCWECHREGEFICCEMCPRVFHLRCANLDSAPPQDWACHHCHAIMLADNVENRSRAMQLISVDQLGMMLKFALNRAKKTPMVAHDVALTGELVGLESCLSLVYQADDVYSSEASLPTVLCQ